MNYWLLILMMIVAVVIVAVVLADELAPSPSESLEREEPQTDGNF